MNRHRWSTIAGLVVMLLVVTLAACTTVIPLGGDDPTNTPESPPPTSTPIPPTPTISSEPVAIDICTLITEEEAAGVLGGPVEIQSYADMGGCTYAQADGDPFQPQFVTLSAAHGEEAKNLLGASLAMMIAFSSAPEARDAMAELQATGADMTLAEMVEFVSPLFEVLGYAPIDLPEIDSPAQWLWDDTGITGALFVLDGDRFVTISLIGYDEGTSLAQTTALMQNVLARLPAEFTVFRDAPPEPDPEGEATLGPVPTDVPDQDREVVALWVTEVTRGQLIRIDTEFGSPVYNPQIGIYSADVLIAGGYVWAITLPENIVVQIDPVINAIVTRHQMPGDIWRLAATEGTIWVTGDMGLARLDIATGEISVVLEEPCSGIAVGDGELWLTQPDLNQVLRVNPDTGAITETIPVEGRPTEIVYGLGMAWVIQAGVPNFARIDPTSGEVTPGQAFIQTHTEPRGIAIGMGDVWVTTDMQRVIRVDPVTLEIQTQFDIEGHSWGVAVGGGSAWVTSSVDGTISRLAGSRVISVIDIGGQVERIVLQYLDD